MNRTSYCQEKSFLPAFESPVKLLLFFEESASAFLIKFSLPDDVPFSLANINDSKLVGVKLHKMYCEINNEII